MPGATTSESNPADALMPQSSEVPVEESTAPASVAKEAASVLTGSRPVSSDTAASAEASDGTLTTDAEFHRQPFPQPQRQRPHAGAARGQGSSGTATPRPRVAFALEENRTVEVSHVSGLRTHTAGGRDDGDAVGVIHARRQVDVPTPTTRGGPLAADSPSTTIQAQKGQPPGVPVSSSAADRVDAVDQAVALRSCAIPPVAYDPHACHLVSLLPFTPTAGQLAHLLATPGSAFYVGDPSAAAEEAALHRVPENPTSGLGPALRMSHYIEPAEATHILRTVRSRHSGVRSDLMDLYGTILGRAAAMRRDIYLEYACRAEAKAAAAAAGSSDAASAGADSERPGATPAPSVSAPARRARGAA